MKNQQNQQDQEDHFEVLRKIQKKPEYTQRELAKDLGFSLGKLNYCIKSLHQKGLIKLRNFKKYKNKFSYVNKYFLTKRGINHRINLTIKFMKAKMNEYDELKAEIKNIKK